MNNMMNMFMQMFGGNFNPMQMMNMFGNNPMMKQAQQMLQGKNPQQMQEVIKNVAKQKGIDENQLNQMINQFKF